MLTFWQRVRVSIRGWLRRREEAARRRDEEFMRREASWGATSAARAPSSMAPQNSGSSIDRDGLQVAFLDDSGRRAYFLDTNNGQVVEVVAADSPAMEPLLRDPERFRRVPARSESGDAEDRKAFALAVENREMRTRLLTALASPSAQVEFRRLLATDRATERAWYNFKNDRAIDAAERWLQEIGEFRIQDSE